MYAAATDCHNNLVEWFPSQHQGTSNHTESSSAVRIIFHPALARESRAFVASEWRSLDMGLWDVVGHVGRLDGGHLRTSLLGELMCRQGTRHRLADSDLQLCYRLRLLLRPDTLLSVKNWTIAS